MNITVYLGASEGTDTMLRNSVRQLGSWIGESGNCLVYGGSKTGLMGEIAESTISSGGSVIGVEPELFVRQSRQFKGLTQLIVTKDISERKAKMIELGDAFIALPGGTGTLEEISEVMSMVSMNYISAPCIIYNHYGFYNGLKQLLETMIEKGLSTRDRLKEIYFADSIEDIIALLTSYERY